MSPRPRQVTNDDILRAAFRAIARLGPARLTLADVAEEAGVSAAALIQRFGSKRALLLAAAADAGGGSQYIFPGLRARYRSPLAALYALAECMELMGTTPEAVANTLAFLRLDLTDPQFHQHALAAARGMHEGICALVRDAIEAGELERCNAARLARALQATLDGSVLNWSIQQDEDLVSWVRRDLETLVRPYQRRKRPAARSVTRTH
jgi:AcrR family transcriptional regulator